MFNFGRGKRRWFLIAAAGLVCAGAFLVVLEVRDTLLVPGMHWRIEHHFGELEGKDKRLRNPTLRGLYLDTAFQMIDFRMDRGGAEVASEAKVYVKPGASYFEFNRPFLIYMKKRGGNQPFFVMWVENAELLQRW